MMLTCDEATQRVQRRDGKNAGPLRHIQARTRQGAGFMADGAATGPHAFLAALSAARPTVIVARANDDCLREGTGQTS